MIIKVCGMREPENIAALERLPIDMMGFIFYPGSPRYVGDYPSVKTRSGIKRVGVFVNESETKIREIAHSFQLDVIQLHGDETPALCNSLRKKGYEIIKSLPVSAATDLKVVADLKTATDFQACVDYLLFDTRCDGFGGSGVQFDWNLLSTYEGSTPFLLSGGISAESAIALQAFHHPLLAGIDLNSKFEISPACKDIPALQSFIQKFKNH